MDVGENRTASLGMIAGYFIAGAVVTALFSGSLARLTTTAKLPEVLAIGMLVPSFTWVVQLAASSVLLRGDGRRSCQAALGRACLLGSVVLLPAAAVNLLLPNAPLWVSAVNVIVSALTMAVYLFWTTAAAGISSWWPASWCATIAVNIALFLWVSRGWWGGVGY